MTPADRHLPRTDGAGTLPPPPLERNFFVPLSTRAARSAPHPPRRGLARTTIVALTAAGTVALAAAPAFAHVTVNPRTATGGSYSQLTFRAPNEEAKADFTKLTIHLPADHPLGSVSTRPLPGWTAATTTAKLAKPITTDDGTTTDYTNTITWTATGGGVPPEQYENFDVSVGPLPDSGTMTFTVDQFYSDGSVVHWDQTAAPGAAEPESPAPVLTLTAASATDQKSSSDSSTVALSLSIAALVIALLTAGVSLLRRRKA